jgi:3',5'-cyclic AMP phosphodiesterase CpdA
MRRLGIPPASSPEVRAATQLQTLQTGGEGFQALPQPAGAAPYRATSAELEIPDGQGRTFHVIGDSGGVKDPNPQKAVAAALVADLTAHPETAFMWHVGDIDYFEGAQGEYVPQFFEAYENYQRHILGIPGNHDGEGGDKLASFMRYFCDSSPRLLPEVAEYNRDTMTQPNCYWTLQDPAVTIIGLYSNVPSGGEIQADQEAWFVGELKAAPAGVPIVVSLHHPPLSVDAHHGGSLRMSELLKRCFVAAGRFPEIILSGHVHDFQHFEWTIEGHVVTCLVVGNSGYHNLHGLAPDATPGTDVAPGVKFVYGDASMWGFLRLAIVGNGIQGDYVQVPKEGTPRSAHTFSIVTGAQ